ncbi:hypothetical protein ACFWYW_56640 [Nonomuraea sp. NPDC059023]|uniref:hypothetical protein n=1 Tax=unclassified Nonomuraea TaxID=2593643 RepID=UPI0036BC60EE
MPLVIDHDQGLTLAHRGHTIGKPAGPSAVSWDYQGQQTHQVTRPDDGRPARRWQVSCGACGKPLEFAVHSVQATVRRQARWRALAWAGLIVLLGSVIGSFVIGGDALPTLIAAAVAGAAVGYLAGGIAADEMGITGHGAGMPIIAKHAVALVESRPQDQPDLSCDTCGHREESPWGSHYRKSWVDKQYRAAKQRMDAHICRTS